jgi:4-phospho-D-threonate 3-dehydrogenase / 4-phospho-D-erythronate 3-dehydrogenase
MTRPVVGITMGDAAGIGPEIIMKALAEPALYEAGRPLVIGDAKILERAEDIVHSGLRVRPVAEVAAARFEPGSVDCLDLDLLPRDLPFGQVSAAAGDAAFRFIERAVRLAEAGQIDAICTAPLNKEALHKGGHVYPGHTEILAELTGTDDFAMMLTARNLRVIHVTTHIGLIDAIARITPERVYRTIRLADQTLRKAGIEAPKIGVCGINPHAGEHGLFGHGEDEEKVAPGVERARAEGVEVDGPLPADTLFFRAGRGDFDAVVAMYHDQGHGPVKVLGLESGVNITVGLPIIRTSVDHGTAFDIAGTGVADEASLQEAIRQAVALAPKR